MTTGEKIALATLILGIVTALVSGGWALYRFRRTSGHSKAPSPPPPDHIDGGSPASSVARASWRINHTGGAQYVLRNVGTNTVEHLFVDESRAPAIDRGLPVNTTVLPNQGVTMLLKGSWQSPMPSELYLRWEGQPEWLAVPLP